jgi:hypothetical protein
MTVELLAELLAAAQRHECTCNHQLMLVPGSFTALRRYPACQTSPLTFTIEHVTLSVTHAALTSVGVSSRCRRLACQAVEVDQGQY